MTIDFFLAKLIKNINSDFESFLNISFQSVAHYFGILIGMYALMRGILYTMLISKKAMFQTRVSKLISRIQIAQIMKQIQAQMMLAQRNKKLIEK